MGRFLDINPSSFDRELNQNAVVRINCAQMIPTAVIYLKFPMNYPTRKDGFHLYSANACFQFE
jgi:hypothetical protein